MTEPNPNSNPMTQRARAGGFTLVEMLAAIGILAVGFTSVLGLMSVGVSTRRSAELRQQAVYAVDRVVAEVRSRGLAAQTYDDEGRPLSLDPMVLDQIDGHPGLRARVTFHYDASAPRLVRIAIRVAWLESGIEVGEDFQRVLELGRDLGARVTPQGQGS